MIPGCPNGQQTVKRPSALTLDPFDSPGERAVHLQYDAISLPAVSRYAVCLSQ